MITSFKSLGGGETGSSKSSSSSSSSSSTSSFSSSSSIFFVVSSFSTILLSLLFDNGWFSFSFIFCRANSLIITFNVGVSSLFWLFLFTSLSSVLSMSIILSLFSLTVFFNSSVRGGLLMGVKGKLVTLCIVGDNIPPGILFSLTGNHQQILSSRDQSFFTPLYRLIICTWAERLDLIEPPH